MLQHDELGPVAYDQSTFFRERIHESNDDCGTVACVHGIASMLAGVPVDDLGEPGKEQYTPMVRHALLCADLTVDEVSMILDGSDRDRARVLDKMRLPLSSIAAMMMESGLGTIRTLNALLEIAAVEGAVLALARHYSVDAWQVTGALAVAHREGKLTLGMVASGLRALEREAGNE